MTTRRKDYDAPNEVIQQLLNQYKAMLEGEAETEATKQFAKDFDDMVNDYERVSSGLRCGVV